MDEEWATKSLRTGLTQEFPWWLMGKSGGRRAADLVPRHIHCALPALLANARPVGGSNQANRALPSFNNGLEALATDLKLHQ